MDQIQEINIKCFHPDLINPTPQNYKDSGVGGTKIVVIGKANTGKSTLIKYLMASKSDLIPTCMVVSGTEDSNKFYSSFVPNIFIHDHYSDHNMQNIIKRQKIGLNYLEPEAVWSLLLLDDCTEDRKIFNSPTQQALYKNGRHWKLFYILSLQHATDIPPAIRTNVDGVFIFRETNENNLNSIYKNYASVIPKFDLFKQVMQQVTGDYTALYIDNTSQDNNWVNNVYWFKAPYSDNGMGDVRFGCDEAWKYNRERCA